MTTTLDALRAALKPFAEIEVPAGASDGTWVARTTFCNNQITAHSVRQARAALEAASTDGEGFVRGLEAAAREAETPPCQTSGKTGYPDRFWQTEGDERRAKNISRQIRALSPAPASKGPVEAELLEIIKDLARSPLRGSNGGTDNFACQGHDLAVLVHRARAAIRSLPTTPPLE